MTDSDDDKTLKLTHDGIEDAIRSHLTALEIDGFVTGWTLGVAITHFEEGEEYDGIFATTSNSLSKWTNIGLTTMMLDSAKEVNNNVELDD